MHKNHFISMVSTTFCFYKTRKSWKSLFVPLETYQHYQFQIYISAIICFSIEFCIEITGCYFKLYLYLIFIYLRWHGWFRIATFESYITKSTILFGFCFRNSNMLCLYGNIDTHAYKIRNFMENFSRPKIVNKNWFHLSYCIDELFFYLKQAWKIFFYYSQSNIQQKNIYLKSYFAIV